MESHPVIPESNSVFGYLPDKSIIIIKLFIRAVFNFYLREKSCYVCGVIWD